MICWLEFTSISVVLLDKIPLNNDLFMYPYVLEYVINIRF